MKKYEKVQKEVIELYRIDLCDDTKCRNDWSRTHAHSKIRRVCKWKQANSAESTLTLLHEIGHIENNNHKMRRCESEYYATVWAIEQAKKYDIEIPDKFIKDYQAYIYRELDRGLKRGGSGYPSKEQMKLQK